MLKAAFGRPIITGSHACPAVGVAKRTPKVVGLAGELPSLNFKVLLRGGSELRQASDHTLSNSAVRSLLFNVSQPLLQELSRVAEERLTARIDLLQ